MSDLRWLRWSFAHEQTPHTATYYVRERFKRRQRPKKVVEPLSPTVPTVEQIADPDNLIRVFYELKACAGQAPGPDGITYADLGRREVPELMRALSAEVRAGTYRPGPARLVMIPKPAGGHRTLRLRDLADRVVSAALNDALCPLWETVFLPMSMGFRKGRGVWRMLAELEAIIVGQDRWVLATDDIKNAFDNVIIGDVLADHANYITNNSLLTLIELVLRGGDGSVKGIDQGGAYSPAALNLRLHHAYDLAHQGQNPPRYRYADNLVSLHRDVAEGNQDLDRNRNLLGKAGFQLKGEDGPPRDLRKGEIAELLGFILSFRYGRLHYHLGGNAWEKLQQDLAKAHTSSDPTATARAVVRGWVNGYGPAFESERKNVVRRILYTAVRCGFREIGSRSDMDRWCNTSWERWRTFRERAGQSSRGSKER
jgi:hypothetical protein